MGIELSVCKCAYGLFMNYKQKWKEVVKLIE